MSSRKQVVYACWTVASEDLSQALSQLCEETPLIWGDDKNSEVKNQGGIELAAGTLTVSFSNEPRHLSAFLRFEAPAPEGFKRSSWLSPIDVMDKPAYDFGRKEA